MRPLSDARYPGTIIFSFILVNLMWSLNSHHRLIQQQDYMYWNGQHVPQVHCWVISFLSIKSDLMSILFLASAELLIHVLQVAIVYIFLSLFGWTGTSTKSSTTLFLCLSNIEHCHKSWTICIRPHPIPCIMNKPSQELETLGIEAWKAPVHNLLSKPVTKCLATCATITTPFTTPFLTNYSISCWKLT